MTDGTGETHDEALSLPPPMLEPRDFRARLLALAAARKAAAVAVAQVDDLAIPGPYGDIPLRLYRPQLIVGLPGILYFHGAGWVGGSLDTHDNIARLLARETGALVVSVDYRLAPEYRYPVALKECFASLQWLAGTAADLGVDAKRIAVAGDSAGGNLAAAVSLMARDQAGPILCAQLLVNPVLDLTAFDTLSYRRAPPETHRMMAGFRAHYVAAGEDLFNPYLSPLKAADLGRLPPALVVTGGQDALKDEDEAYMRALQAAGVRAAGFCIADQGHFGMTWATGEPEIADAIIASARFLRQEFGCM